MIRSLNDRAALSNGVPMPQIGLGVWKVPSPDAPGVVTSALKLGYRMIDTAAIYKNEIGVGEGIKQSGVPREEIFIVTKLWNENMRQNTVLQGFEDSLKALGVDFIDLYLMHWPVPGKYVKAWKTMLEIYRSGRVRAIGVCNCNIRHLEELAQATGSMPAVNQVERHPLLSQQPMRAFCREHNIRLCAYSPLMQGNLNEPLFLELGEKYHKSPAQIILRWHLQEDVTVIPKSVHSERQAQNLDIFDFELSMQDMERIDACNQDSRFCADPDNFNF